MTNVAVFRGKEILKFSACHRTKYILVTKVTFFSLKSCGFMIRWRNLYWDWRQL